MRTSKASRTQQPFVAVQEPGKGKALLHVLADGRNTGHYKLSERKLTEVGGNVVSSLPLRMLGQKNYSIQQDAVHDHDM